MRNKEQYQVSKRLYAASSDLDYLLDVFGDTLAKRQGYKGLSGLEAVHYYLIQKHNWLPSQVLTMSLSDLRLALHQEMQGWTAPTEAL